MLEVVAAIALIESEISVLVRYLIDADCHVAQMAHRGLRARASHLRLVVKRVEIRHRQRFVLVIRIDVVVVVEIDIRG